MGTASDNLAALQRAASAVLQSAKDTVVGVGFACFPDRESQEEAFQQAWAKEAAAKRIVDVIADFKAEHGDFN